jgi:hypothetical protein
VKTVSYFLLFFSLVQSNPARKLLIFDGPTLFARDESVAREITGIGLSNGGLGMALRAWTTWDTVRNSAEDQFYENFTNIQKDFQNIIPQDLLERQKDDRRAIRNESGKKVPPLLAAILDGKLPLSEVIGRLSDSNRKIAKTLEPENLNRIMKVKRAVLDMVSDCKKSGQEVLILTGLHPEVSREKIKESFPFIEDQEVVSGIDYDLNNLIASRGVNPENCLFIGTQSRLEYPKSCGLGVFVHNDKFLHKTRQELRRIISASRDESNFNRNFAVSATSYNPN